MLGEFVVPRCEAAELFETGEEVFDEMASAITMRIEGTRGEAIRTRWDHRFGACLFDQFDQRVGVVTFVADDRLNGADRLDQRRRLRDVRLLGAGEREGQRIAQRVGDQVDFRAPAAARSPQ